jgi:hypothetical protein
MTSGSGTSLARRLLLGSRKLRVGLAVVVILAALGVGILQVVPLWDRKATIESAGTTEGTITGAEYGKNTYRITYEYTVDGASYESSRVFPGPYAPGGTASQQVLGQIPAYDPPESATVHYDSGDPGYAWLHTRESVVSRHVVYFFAGGAVAVLLLGYLYVEWKLPNVMRDDPGEGSSGGLGRIGRVLGLLKGAAVVVLVGGLVLVGVSVALGQVLVP